MATLTSITRALRRFAGGIRAARRPLGVSRAILFALRTTLPLYTARLDYSGAPISLVLNSRTDIQRLYGCHKEPETVEWIVGGAKEGAVLYDIGANVGAYSLVASSCGAQVVAFEPAPATFATLSDNLMANRMYETVLPILVALGATDGDDTLLFSSTESGAAQHGWGSLGGSTKHGSSLRLPAVRLDTIRASLKLPDPSMLKIDVDGAEHAVLEGAHDTLRLVSVQTVLIEIDETQCDAVAITKLMVDAGFTITQKHPRGKGRSTTLFNYIFHKHPVA